MHVTPKAEGILEYGLKAKEYELHRLNFAENSCSNGAMAAAAAAAAVAVVTEAAAVSGPTTKNQFTPR
jgi:hypothetical protein